MSKTKPLATRVKNVAAPASPSSISNPTGDEARIAKSSPVLLPAKASVAVWVNEGGAGGEVKR